MAEVMIFDTSRGLKRRQDGEEAQRQAKMVTQVRAVPGPGAAGEQHAAAAQHETSSKHVQYAVHVIS